MRDDGTIQPAKVKLRGGTVALVDLADYEMVSRYKWFNAHGYAVVGVRRYKGRGGQRQLSMHRLIMGQPDCPIDHINRDKLDNRRSNLRLASHALNMRNRDWSDKTQSGIKGVHPHAGKWQAAIWLDGRLQHLGTYSNKVDARDAYLKAARQFFPEVAA